MLSISGHKLYGPKGVGALYVRDGIEFDSFLDGGHQEKNKRAGTENVAGIVGFGKACELAEKNLSNHIEHLTTLREYYIEKILKEFPNAILNGSRDKRLPGNTNISFENIDGEELLLKLDNYGICASAGSACNTGNLDPSHVLTAIGLEPKIAQSSLRVTFGEDNTKEEIDFLVRVLKKCNISVTKKS
jgi:cysteine desulfurase